MTQIGCLQNPKIYILLHPGKYSNVWSPTVPLILITLVTILYHWLQGTIEYVTQQSCLPLLSTQLNFTRRGITEPLFCAMYEDLSGP